MRWIKVWIGDIPASEDPIAYLKPFVFELYLLTHEREYTGYKEIEEWGLPENLPFIGRYSRSGGCKVKQTDMIFIGNRRHREVYYFNPDAFYETDVYKVILNRDTNYLMPYKDWLKYDEAIYAGLPDELQVWFSNLLNNNNLKKPANEILTETLAKYRRGDIVINKTDPCEYDKEMFDKLPEDIKRWFLRKVNTRTFSRTAQDLLNHTYQKFVVNGVQSYYQSATTSKKEDTTNSLSTTSTESSSTNTTNGK